MERQFQNGMSHFGVVHLPDDWRTVDDVKRDLDVLDGMVRTLQDDLDARAAHQDHLRSAVEVFLDMQRWKVRLYFSNSFSLLLRSHQKAN